MFLILYSMISIVWCTAQQHNFLLIIVDDLRPALECYGDKNAYTPNINRLAENAAVFSRAYAQQALCAPSRNSFLTSKRPDSLQLYDFYSYWRKDVGNFTTLPQHLKNSGYVTKSIGKVFHPGISSNHSDDSPYSWTEVPFHPYTEKYKDLPVCQTNFHIPPAQNLVCPVKVSSMLNKTLPDMEILKEAKHFLQTVANDPTPFFLAVGFQKPHIPFKYPKKYLKHHPLRKFKVPDPYEWPENVSSIAYNPWIDLRKRKDIESLNLNFPWERIPNSFGKLIMQSYYAAVSYIDDLIGKLIDRLDILSIRKNTTIILTSDHGWSLGEHAVWAKYSNYDVALRVPLIISTSGIGDSALNLPKKQMVIDSLVELVDIFPTIADLANIPIPICRNENENERKNATRMKRVFTRPELVCSEGVSLVPLIAAAIKQELLPWKKAAFGQYPRPGIKPSMNPNSDEPRFKQIKAMGYTLRTDRYRYTAWLKFNPQTRVPNWNLLIAEELYDHEMDKNENKNLVVFPRYQKLKETLRTLLKRGWRYALPGKMDF
ncbi:iduronate 2-sulfatase isoform X2 [Halictus rubicundus]|uniref:iduronate 2-sulfatase isoform X2 n=1 Tax=Halictus rubicundus TaxID=77578 RepID=UPI0040354E5A